MRVVDEIRVGIVVVLALLLALSGYFFLRGAGPLARADHYRLLVEQGVAIVAAGNDVRFQGVKVGEVKKVELHPQSQKPLLTLSIDRRDPPIELRDNYLYTVRAVSPIGENYVDIRPDPRSRGAAGVLYAANQDGQIIRGGRAVPGLTEAGEQVAGASAQLTQQVMKLGRDFKTTQDKFNVTLDRINKGVLSYQNQVRLARTLEGVTRLTQRAQQGFGPQGVRVSLGDPRSQRALNSTLENAAAAAREGRAAAGNINRLTRDLGGVVRQNKGQLRGLLATLNRTAEGVTRLTQNLNTVVHEGGLKENATIAFRSLRRAAENVEAGTASFKAIAGDPATQQNLRDTLAALRDATQSLRDTAVTVNAVINDPEAQGQLKGTLATLSATAGTLQTSVENLRDISAGLKNVVADAQVQANLKESAANLNGTLAATRAAAERVNALLGGRRRRNPDANGQNADTSTRQSTQLPSGFDFTYRRLGNLSGNLSGAARRDSDLSGRNFGGVTFNAELFGAPFRLGLSNIGEGDDLTLQTGRFLGQNAALRYGLYRSKLGAGAEVRKGRFSLEGNIWDPNRRSANAYLGFQVTPQLEILAGREHLGGVRANSIGVRLRP